ncbi:uncharacterized protein LOC132264835 [Phlebotomus argentipes]|uniref:uncharacterized protein LOC132264835 n=1 Tax=Phlebotomus argentipes TaxID=94469 RepID=UPI002892F9A6|nr:uncharacterized protein LOC132264835 [Phlebotomus argentipes]
MRILLLVLPFLVSGYALEADDGYDIWDPFIMDLLNWIDDPTRFKRDPLSIFLSYENDQSSKNTDAPKIIDMSYDNEGKEVIKKLIHTGDTNSQGSPKFPQITIINEKKSCKCKKSKKKTPTEEQPKEIPATQYEDPFEKLRPSRAYTPTLDGRINVDKSEEEIKMGKQLWSMSSEELNNGKYAKASGITDAKSSLISSFASNPWDPYPFAQPTYEKHLHNQPKIRQVPETEAYPHYSLFTGEFSPQDIKEMAMIHRINSEHDLSPGESEYDQRERIKDAVMDYIRSKYYTKIPKKRVIAESTHTSY